MAPMPAAPVAVPVDERMMQGKRRKLLRLPPPKGTEEAIDGEAVDGGVEAGGEETDGKGSDGSRGGAGMETSTPPASIQRAEMPSSDHADDTSPRWLNDPLHASTSPNDPLHASTSPNDRPSYTSAPAPPSPLRPLTRTAISSHLRTILSHPLPPTDPVHECGPATLSALSTDPAAAMHLAHTRIHVFPFKDVRKCWLRLWVESSLWRAVHILEGVDEEGKMERGVKEEGEGDWIRDLVKVLDMALILAGGVGREDVVEWAFRALEVLLEEDVGNGMDRPPAGCPAGVEDQSGISNRSRVEQADRCPKRRKLSQDANRDWREGNAAANIPNTFPTSALHAPPLRFPIPRHHNPSLELFQAHLDAAIQPLPSSRNGDGGHSDSKPEDISEELPAPLIITGALEHWPALSDPCRCWKNPQYLLRKTLGGRRLVPVEIGRSYTDEGWGQGIITFREFLEKYMFDESDESKERASEASSDGGDGDEGGKTGYLAQHDLFAQIPSLRADIAVPDYCYANPPHPPPPPPPPSLLQAPNKPLALPPGHPDFPLLNAWFGPADTVSPLHTDPYHNILAQVVGSKYIRLYPPSQSDRLYPRGVGDDGVDMGNTSRVDMAEAMAVSEGWDEREWVGGGGGGGHGDDGDAPSKEETWAREEERKMRLLGFEDDFPLFGQASHVEGVLRAGECLYVPKGWWHYVRSLSPSFSVSFWWD